MSWLLLCVVASVVVLAIGARWLFRQRSPSEIIAAREKLKAIRRKREPRA